MDPHYNDFVLYLYWLAQVCKPFSLSIFPFFVCFIRNKRNHHLMWLKRNCFSNKNSNIHKWKIIHKRYFAFRDERQKDIKTYGNRMLCPFFKMLSFYLSSLKNTQFEKRGFTYYMKVQVFRKIIHYSSLCRECFKRTCAFTSHIVLAILHCTCRPTVNLCSKVSQMIMLLNHGNA